MALNCTSGSLPFPTLFGAEILSVRVAPVRDYVVTGAYPYNWNTGLVPVIPISFCNVSVVHTHPGQNDTLRTEVWLPFEPSEGSAPEWNGRFEMTGGGGFAAVMVQSIVDGSAASTADAGVTINTASPAAWALSSDGNVNYNSLQNFAFKGLYDGALISKEVIKSFYGRPAQYSYFSGCSGGGRQGYTFAQRFPEVFDGIVATAPAIHWPQFFLTSRYYEQVMGEEGEVPYACELDTLYKAVMATCDRLDGLIDGVISYPDHCNFDPYSLVGSPANCSSDQSGPSTISHAAAAVANAVWHGVRTEDGSLLFPSAGYEANLSSLATVNTTCAGKENCTTVHLELFDSFLKLFVLKDASASTDSLTREEYIRYFRLAVKEYQSILGMDNPDLTELKKTGNKLLTWHGLNDDLIPYGGTRRYYDSVARLDPDVHSYYRLFEAPGVGHCAGGLGGKPNGVFAALVAWVENGTVPDSLVGTTPTNKTTLLCPYPKQAVFKGNSPSFSRDDFVCSQQI
ncbi:feruloyl esterase b precursor [Stagonosporopsis vannaccii]|nr:feruloyl esterase b precursor [Stagonosporopsis vannaccii]